ncbi:MAG TPA: hypothetical protein VJ733_03350 [Candidatus Binatia bacterium]|nr:MAG: hypothetical protein A2Z25_17465 [Planctomycetes bacterium RBG_16_55_9]HJX09518.1 hypothetical protein [Candidatus Binatia bacterium]
MDNLETSSSGNQEVNKPIPFDDSGPGGSGVSHSPLDLGGVSAVQKQQVAAPKPVVRPIASPVMAAKPAPKLVPNAARIEGVKTFFTKLHPGAISFLDEQITRWLNENPSIVVKRTNVAVGEVQAKKTEPNILISVWY